METRTRVKLAYDRYAERIEEQGYRFNPVYVASKALSDWILLTTIDLTDKYVLNIGCAEPIDELQFVEKVKRWVAFDINEKLIQKAEQIARRKLSSELFRKLQFIQGDATEIEFANNTFDIVVSFSTIEHIPGGEQRARVVHEMARVVKPGGHVIVTVPNRFSTFYFAHLRNIGLGISDYGYSYLYTPFELKKLLKSTGLVPTRFVSEYSALEYFPSVLPRGARRILRLLEFFGERIGWLCIKK